MRLNRERHCSGTMKFVALIAVTLALVAVGNAWSWLSLKLYPILITHLSFSNNLKAFGHDTHCMTCKDESGNLKPCGNKAEDMISQPCPNSLNCFKATFSELMIHLKSMSTKILCPLSSLQEGFCTWQRVWQAGLQGVLGHARPSGIGWQCQTG